MRHRGRAPQALRIQCSPMSAPLDIAIAGTRGVPANYSGFETFAEELGKRLGATDRDPHGREIPDED